MKIGFFAYHHGSFVVRSNVSDAQEHVIEAERMSEADLDPLNVLLEAEAEGEYVFHIQPPRKPK